MFNSLFFFSSRRRHTRCLSDWSSDVCSSDLPSLVYMHKAVSRSDPQTTIAIAKNLSGAELMRRARERSEERRVGKEWRCARKLLPELSAMSILRYTLPSVMIMFLACCLVGVL